MLINLGYDSKLKHINNTSVWNIYKSIIFLFKNEAKFSPLLFDHPMRMRWLHSQLKWWAELQILAEDGFILISEFTNTTQRQMQKLNCTIAWII